MTASFEAPYAPFDPDHLHVVDVDDDAPEFSTDFLTAGLGDPEDAADQHDNADRQQYDQPDADFIKPPPRKRNARGYERKVAGLLNIPFVYAIQNEATVPDAAALFMHGPKISAAMGNWAADNDNIARGIDWLTTGSENPAAQFVAAVAPLAFQLIRNHEPQLETLPQRGIRLPGRGKDGQPRRLRLLPSRFTLKLKRLRPLTNDPDALAAHVFNNPNVRAQLAKQKLTVRGFEQ